MIEQLKIYASLAALLLFSTWFVFSINPDEVPVPPISEAKPDYYMETFVTIAFDQSGEIKQQISAQRVAHYTSDNRSELSELTVSANQEDQNQWKIQADRGTAQMQNDQLALLGNIKIFQSDRPDAIMVRTDSLQVDMGGHKAETPDLVTITSPDGRIEGRGMEIHFLEHTLELNSAVRGVYEIPHE